MGHIASLAKKDFLVEREGEKKPQRARAEAIPNPRYVDEPDAIREAIGPHDGDDGNLAVVKLTLPDGAEWLVRLATLESVLRGVRESEAWQRASAVRECCPRSAVSLRVARSRRPPTSACASSCRMAARGIYA
jgi:hypothetical protein